MPYELSLTACVIEALVCQRFRIAVFILSPPLSHKRAPQAQHTYIRLMELTTACVNGEEEAGDVADMMVEY